MPDADVKIYLNASLAERARRRCTQLSDAGSAEPIEEILADMRRRDRIDSERSASPLKPADDAMIVETVGKSVDEVVQEIAGLVVALLSAARVVR